MFHEEIPKMVSLTVSVGVSGSAGTSTTSPRLCDRAPPNPSAQLSPQQAVQMLIKPHIDTKIRLKIVS